MSPQFKSALTRSGIMVLVAALGASQSFLLGESNGRLALAMFIGSLIPIISRLGEGVYDTYRANAGKVHEGDIQRM